MAGRIFSVNIGDKKSEPKKMVKEGLLKEGFGFQGDVHAGSGDRQVSLLAIEEIEAAEESCDSAQIDFRPGIFAENITTAGIDLSKVRAGDKLMIGDTIVLKVTRIGKECHSGCRISLQIGKCIMPRQGVFATVEKGGPVKVGDRMELQKEKTFFSWSKT